jgi:mannose-6-phosphate isomerase
MAAEMHTLAEAARWYDAWLREAALPLWGGAGVDSDQGFFHEALTVDGRAHIAPRRSRVQARQVFVFATCAKRGHGPALLPIARRGFEGLVASYRLPDGLFINSVSARGLPYDEGVDIYEQAFALLAMAALHAVDPSSGDLPKEASGRSSLAGSPGGGRRVPRIGCTSVPGQLPYAPVRERSCLGRGRVASWTALSDELAELALGKFIDDETGVLREFFDSEWRPLEGEGGLIEPGHHFEWAWLLERWGRARGDGRARETARRLYANGLRGVDSARQVAMNALWEDFSIRDANARLWPQTEHLKATLFFGDDSEILRAAQGLAKYLDVPARGAWRDKMQADGSFLTEPSPATSFYHLLTAVLELQTRKA